MDIEQKTPSKDVLTSPSKNQDSVFSGEFLPTIPDNTGGLQNCTRFKPGVSGNPNGRPKGAKNKLTELFLNTVIEDFAQHGADALKRLRDEDPAYYIKTLAVLLPKKLIQNYEMDSGIDLADLTNEEAVELLERIKKRRFMEKVIETVSKS
jgi:hypothetical protein